MSSEIYFVIKFRGDRFSLNSIQGNLVLRVSFTNFIMYVIVK